MLWFNFILGSIFTFLCFILIIIHCHAQKQRKIKIEPRIELNHNTCTCTCRYMYYFSNICILTNNRVFIPDQSLNCYQRKRMQCLLAVQWRHFILSVMYPSMADYLNWMDSNHFQLIMVGGGLGCGGGGGECTGRQEPVRKMEEAERT